MESMTENYTPRLAVLILIIAIVSFVFLVASSNKSTSFRTEKGLGLFEDVLHEVRIRINVPDHPTEQHKTTWSYENQINGCPNTFAVTFTESSSLGEWLFKYAHLFGLCQMYGCVPYLPEKGYNFVETLFPDLKMKTTEALKKCNISFSDIGFDSFVTELSKNETAAKAKNYLLHRLTDAYTYFSSYYLKIRPHLSIGNDIRRRAIDIIKNYKNKYKSATAIGVHVKRRGTNPEEHLPVSYYRSSFDHFKSKFPEAVFIVASDDMKWAKENINFEGFNIELADNGTWNSAHLDFAVLANCDHNVYGEGAFGFWASFLAKGSMTYPVGFIFQKSGVDQMGLIIQSLQLPNWIPIYHW